MGEFFSTIDITWWSEVSVLIFLTLFLGIVLYTYLPSRKKEHERNAELPLDDHEQSDKHK